MITYCIDRLNNITDIPQCTLLFYMFYNSGVFFVLSDLRSPYLHCYNNVNSPTVGLISLLYILQYVKSKINI